MALGVAVVGGLLLLSRKQNLVPLSAYDKARYRYKAYKGKRAAKNALSSVTDAVQGAYHDAKSTVEKAIA